MVLAVIAVARFSGALRPVTADTRFFLRAANTT
jgi:hypothetical protein